MNDDEMNMAEGFSELEIILRQTKQPLPSFDNAYDVYEDIDYNNVHPPDKQPLSNRIVLPDDVSTIPIPTNANYKDDDYISNEGLSSKSLQSGFQFTEIMFYEVINRLIGIAHKGIATIVDAELLTGLLRVVYLLQSSDVDASSNVSLQIFNGGTSPEPFLDLPLSAIIKLSDEAFKRFIELIHAGIPVLQDDIPNEIENLCSVTFE